MGKDYTLFAKIDGIVQFQRKDRDRKKVAILPAMIEEPSPAE
jgi:large subunit ribosomal protein L27